MTKVMSMYEAKQCEPLEFPASSSVPTGHGLLAVITVHELLAQSLPSILHCLLTRSPHNSERQRPNPRPGALRRLRGEELPGYGATTTLVWSLVS